MEVEDLGLALERGFWGLRGFKTGMNADLTLLISGTLAGRPSARVSHGFSLLWFAAVCESYDSSTLCPHAAVAGVGTGKRVTYIQQRNLING